MYVCQFVRLLFLCVLSTRSSGSRFAAAIFKLINDHSGQSKTVTVLLLCTAQLFSSPSDECVCVCVCVGDTQADSFCALGGPSLHNMIQFMSLYYQAYAPVSLLWHCPVHHCYYYRGNSYIRSSPVHSALHAVMQRQ